MQHVGDDLAGFSVEHPTPDQVLVKAWGFWSVEIAQSFEPVVVEACRGRARDGRLTLDMSEVKPMREEGQQSFSRVVRALSTLGIGQASIVTTNPLTKLQLVRLVTESRTTAKIDWVTGANSLARTM